jgi:DNA-binding NarL/FixJ family response regulator
VLVEALRRIPEFTRAPIFVFGSKENRTSAGAVFDSGANAFLPKPLNRQVLFSMIERFLPNQEIFSTRIPVEIINSAPSQPAAFSRVFVDSK